MSDVGCILGEDLGFWADAGCILGGNLGSWADVGCILGEDLGSWADVGCILGEDLGSWADVGCILGGDLITVGVIRFLGDSRKLLVCFKFGDLVESCGLCLLEFVFADK